MNIILFGAPGAERHAGVSISKARYSDGFHREYNKRCDIKRPRLDEAKDMSLGENFCPG